MTTTPKKTHPKGPTTSAGAKPASADTTPKGADKPASSAMEYQLGFATGPTG
ncbi:hypothetical protein OE810_12285 [Rhodobacteraceae bacterium XHP0102]|nr:hypothetical protein [Rhodobacteraceae bacterium XHP0102]